ncbi:MAG: site-specific tyrosine recombinase XerD [Candidatus Kapaibacteriales bacterium]
MYEECVEKSYIYIDKFTSALSAKGLSEHTIESYAKSISLFYSFLKEEFNTTDIENLDSEDIRLFFGWLNDRGSTKRTIAQRMSAVRTFFAWLKKSKLVKTDITQTIASPKIDKKLPVWVTNSEIIILLNEIEEVEKYSEYDKQLFASLILLIYGSGLRVSEALGLKISDLGKGSIKVLGKGKKNRNAYLTSEASSSLKELIKLRISKGHRLNNSSLVFCTEDSSQLNRQAAYKHIKSLILRSGINSEASPHTLRHSFATHLLNNGAGIESVGELLGHSSLSSTQIYTHVSIERLKKVHSQAHPRA